MNPEEFDRLSTLERAQRLHQKAQVWETQQRPVLEAGYVRLCAIAADVAARKHRLDAMVEHLRRGDT